MPRLPLIDESTAAPEAKAQLAATRGATGRVLNLHRTMAHAPRLAAATQAMALALRNETAIARRLKELIVLRTARFAGSDYEWAQHEPMAAAAGVTAAEIAALRQGQAPPSLSPAEAAALVYVDAVLARRSTESSFPALLGHFTAPAILAITLTATFYLGTAHMLAALDVPLET